MPTKFQKPEARAALQREVKEKQTIRSNPHTWERVAKKDQFIQQEKRAQGILDQITPPDTDGKQKDKINARADMLAGAMVKGKPGVVCRMPSEQQQWKPSTGTIGQNIEHDRYWKTHTLDAQGNAMVAPKGRGLFSELKDLDRMRYKEREDYDPDVASIEKYRPVQGAPLLSEFRGPMSYAAATQAGRKNFDEVFPDRVPLPVEQKIFDGNNVESMKVVPPEVPAPKEKKKRSPSKPWTGPTCEAKKPDGSICGGRALPGKKHCFSKFHAKQFVTPAPLENPDLQET